MANKFKVTFVGTNQAADATKAKLFIRKRKIHPSNDDDAEDEGNYQYDMDRDNPHQVPAKFSKTVNIGGVGAGYKRLIRVVAKKANVVVATVDGPSPDRL